MTERSPDLKIGHTICVYGNHLSLTAERENELLEETDELNQIKKSMLTSIEVLSEQKSLNQKDMENLRRVKDVELINLKEELEIVRRNAKLKEDQFNRDVYDDDSMERDFHRKLHSNSR
ncbi:hypothetical protein WA026_019358 [Henosepilachna vigintioctopunctata]|uniref:Uncharacterized protein n=1 Tax=Henosepilachna vigintioctopunctata TaxID=420089 RepID=A0AAW1UC03_9CUCU